MKFILAILILIFSTAIIGQNPASLSDNQKLKAEVFKLKAQLSQCQLNMEQKDLINEFSKSLGVTEGAVFDWNTLTFRRQTDGKGDSNK